MLLERLAVAGFGRLPAGLELTFAPGLNLILAPNESGKSTLCELIVGLFYGYGSRSGGVHPFEPWTGGETGGELRYRLADGRAFLLRRHLAGRGERLTLADAQQRPVDLGPATPGEAHLGCGRGVFLTISRIQLDDLGRAFSGETPKELRQSQAGLLGYFFEEAATRGELANPVEVLAAWGAERARLWSRDRRSGREGARLEEDVAAAEQARRQAIEGEARAAALQTELAEARRGLEGLRRRLQEARAAREAAAARLARARDLARRRQLAAQAEELTAQGLADEVQERSAAELDRSARENATAAERARHAASELAAQADGLTGGRGPEVMGRALDELAGRLASLDDAARRRDVLALGLAERERTLAVWGLPAAELAALPGDLPFAVGRAQGEAALSAARAEALEADRDGAGAPPAGRAWALALGPALLASGGVLAAWRTLARHLPAGAAALLEEWDRALAAAVGPAGFEALAWCGAALGVAGLALAVWGWWSRRGARAWQDQLDEISSRARAARRDAKLARETLDLLASPLGRPGADLDPAALAAAQSEAATLSRARADHEQEGRRLEEARTSLAADLARWGAATGQDPAGMLAQTRRRQSRARDAAAEAARQQAAAAEAARLAADAGERLAALLTQGGWADLAALAAARQRARRLEGLRAALAEVDQRLDGPPADDEVLDPAQAEDQSRLAREHEAEVERLGRELGERAARLDEQLSYLLKQESAAQAEARLQGILERREELARRHDTLLLAEGLLKRAMEEFRLEAQPSLLKRAAAYLEDATGGSWSWLGTDIFSSERGKEPELWALAGPGASERAAGVLSRGTRDQLYLSLRLALADEMTAGAEPLPLVLDDPLVNFDDARQKAALEIIRRVSQRRQVILLTCHQAQAAKLEDMCDVNRLSLG